MKLEDIVVYTITGKKHLYKLGDGAYGEWLVYKNNIPMYYLNIYDDLYKDLPELIKKDPYNYLKMKLKQNHKNLTLTQGLFGFWSWTVNYKHFDLEKLPLSLFE